MFDPVHKRLAELLADGYLLPADENMIITDRLHEGDIDDIGIVYPGERGGELFFDILEPPVDEQLVGRGDDTDVFFLAFEIEDLFEQDLLKCPAGFDEEIFFRSGEGGLAFGEGGIGSGRSG